MGEQKPEKPVATLAERTLGHLRTAWRDIAQGALVLVNQAAKPASPQTADDALAEQMQACLMARGGEVSARARAAQLGRSYLAADQAGRRAFLSVLAHRFGPDRTAVDAACAAVVAAADADARRKAEAQLRQTLEPASVKLLTQFNGLPEGVKFLVDLRSTLMAESGKDPALGALESTLRTLLASWFDIGFLELRRITWDAPASLLEKLIAYEAVHEIRSWTDLKNRLDSDRRCFAYFHPRMPDEPLIFVEVALVRGMTGRVDILLDETAPVDDPHRADTAIFYSISNCQKGLAGISFGNFLIKRVVDRVSQEFPNIQTFATLSPIPGLRTWVQAQRAAGALFTDEEATHLDSGNPEILGSVKEPLLKAAAQYLTTTRTGRALDPVAHFHLSNGAAIEQLNWLADPSPKGFAQSFGLMVNYRYVLRDIDANHEHYRGDGRIALGAGVKTILKRAEKSTKDIPPTKTPTRDPGTPVKKTAADAKGRTEQVAASD